MQTESETTKYYTTYKDIKKWFKYINDVVFDGKLARFNDIVIKDLRRQKCYGQVTQWEWSRKNLRVPFRNEYLLQNKKTIHRYIGTRNRPFVSNEKCRR